MIAALLSWQLKLCIAMTDRALNGALTPPCRHLMHILIIPSGFLKPVLYIRLSSLDPDSISFWPCTRHLRRMNLCGASLTAARLWEIACAMGLSVRLLISRMVGCLVMTCCRRVWTCVASMIKSNGPARQLLVFRLRVLVRLHLLLPVASTRTGAYIFRLCNRLIIPQLSSCGSTRLRIIMLQERLAVVYMVLRLLRVRLMMNFLVLSFCPTEPVRPILLLMISMCTPRSELVTDNLRYEFMSFLSRMARELIL